MTCKRPAPMLIRGSVLALACLSMLTPMLTSIAVAETVASQAIIESRRASLKKMGAAMKVLVDQSKSDSPDKAKMVTSAQLINSTAPELPRWFPVGSGPEAGVETDALPYIWKNREKFDAIATQLIAESKKLTTVLSNSDVASVKTQTKALGEVCASCHRSFRAD